MYYCYDIERHFNPKGQSFEADVCLLLYPRFFLWIVVKTNYKT